MGSKTLGCFPTRRRCWWQGGKRSLKKERSPSKASSGTAESTPPASPPSSPTSPTADPQSGLAYFSGKARLSFRHQLDSEREATS